MRELINHYFFMFIKPDLNKSNRHHKIIFFHRNIKSLIIQCLYFTNHQISNCQ